MDEQERLLELKNLREKAEQEYYQFKKEFSNSNEYNDYRLKRIQKILDSDKIQDPAIAKIFEDRINSIKQFQENEAEYIDAVEKGWVKTNEDLDYEEKELLKQIELEEEKEREGGDEKTDEEKDY